MNNSPQIEKEEGKGRTFIILYERTDAFNRYKKHVPLIEDTLTQKNKVLTISLPQIEAKNWKSVSTKLLELLTEKKVRQASYLGLGGTSSIIQFIALKNLKSVRTAIFINATTRPHPTRMERIFDKLENFFPLGLPFRLRAEGFYASPFLQRLRCPILVVTSPEATEYESAEALRLQESLPTSWQLPIHSNDDWNNFSEKLVEFQDVPAKCPQKNI